MQRSDAEHWHGHCRWGRAFVGQSVRRKIHFCQFRDHSERWPAGREGPLGRGRVDFPAIVATLQEVGYEGIIHPEHLGKPSHSGEDLLAKAVGYVQHLLSALEVEG